MIIAGIGLRQGATETALREALDKTGRTPDAMACLDAKRSDALAGLAKALGIPLIELPEAAVAGIPTLSCSPRIKARFATGSLAEALALAALQQKGHKARLIAPRVKSNCGMATAALAERMPS